MRIVLIEDDAAVAAMIRRGLELEGIEVEWFADAPSGGARLKQGGFDVAIVDVMLPGGDGLTAIAEARAARERAPMLVLSARDRIEDRVRGLDVGADDYLIKPFAFAELLARLRALHRRAEKEPSAPIELRGLVIDFARRAVSLGERALSLSRTEYEILAMLARRAGEVVARRELLRHVWGYTFDPGTNVVDVHVAHLRRKIASAPLRIVTVRGVGYRLVDDDV